MSPDCITGKDEWCPLCRFKSEKKLLDWLKKEFPKCTIAKQLRLEECRNPNTGKYLPYDFAIAELRCIIELDGEQHFKQVSNWASHLETQKRDIYKTRIALKNNISVIRIYQPDVLKDTFDWKAALRGAIAKCNTLCVHYISKKQGVYDEHRRLLAEPYAEL